MLGSHINTEIGMARPSTNGRRGMGHVEDQKECRRGQENVTKSVESVEDKAVDKDGYRTPSNPPIMVASFFMTDDDGPPLDSRGTEPEPIHMQSQRRQARGRPGVVRQDTGEGTP